MGITGGTKEKRETDVAIMLREALRGSGVVTVTAVGRIGSEVYFHVAPDGQRREYRLRVEEVS